VLPDLLSASLRGLSFVAMAQAAGAMLFLAAFSATLDSSRRHIENMAWLATVAALILLPVQFSLEAARMTGSFAGLFDADLQRFALSTPGARVLALRIIGLLLVLAGIKNSFRAAMPIGVAGVLMVAASFALTGHTASHAERWLLGPLVALHVLIVSIWFGSLRPLVQIVQSETHSLAAQVVRKYSRIAGVLVPIILLAGLVIAARLLPDARSLWTVYGSILIGKVLAFAVLMALAVLNKRKLGPAIATEGGPARRTFQAAVMAEWGIIVVVLFATAFLTTFWSPRA